MSSELLTYGAIGLVLLGLIGGLLLAFRASRRRWERDRAILEGSKAADLMLPPSLHPIVDESVCMGSGACVKACPEHGILGIVDGKATLISPTQCIGHGRCAVVCPVDAIRLVFGTSERGIDLPMVDSKFETARKGIYIIGELAGMGLIKNAITQGVQVGDTLQRKLNGARGGRRMWDVAIVGAGPAGLAAATACRAAGLNFSIVDQDTVGGTVAHYPRHKVVMTETVKVPLYGEFGRTVLSKEELLKQFHGMIRAADIKVHERAKVSGIDGGEGEFRVHTTRGDIDARTVVLALGRRGSPRKLGVPGEDLEKVTYRLSEPTQYNGKRVLVIGGGDSAVECAVQLAEASTAEVAISYRKPMFARCRPKNKQKIDHLIQTKKIQAIMSSNVKQVAPNLVVLEQNGKQLQLPNDFLIVNAGGELPTKFLKSCGIEIETHFETAPAKAEAEGGAETKPSYFGLALAFLGFSILALLIAAGFDYYPLPMEARVNHPNHDWLKPSGVWGHGVGVGATMVMLLNFLYAARKRIRMFGRIGKMRDWMTFHVFVGVMSPLVIAFHAAFQSNNLLATTTAASLAIVVGTGLVGRFFFSFLPTARGKVLSKDDIKKQWKDLMAMIEQTQVTATDAVAVAAISAAITHPPDHTGGMLSLAMRLPLQRWHARGRAKKARSLFASKQDFYKFRVAYMRLSTLWLQSGFYEQLRKLMTTWRVFHIVLSILLVFIMAAHIALSLYLGYGWIFFG